MAMETNELIDVHELTPFKKFIMSIGAIPTSYLESMSYAELLMWFCNYLQNTVIPTVNNNGQAVEELQTLFVELHNYVENYFDNLDVQDEINNKLDIMAANGTLAEIIEDYATIPELTARVEDLEDITSERCIFIGDSYGVGTTNTSETIDSWIVYLKQHMELDNTNSYSFAEGGAGFVAIGVSGHTFRTLLEANISSVTDKDSITKIIVCGGFNDRNQNVETAINNFVTYAKGQFSNAKIYIGMIGNTSEKSTNGNAYRYNLYNNCLASYKRCSKYGAIYLSGVEYALKDYSLMSNDYQHPNADGYKTIASFIYTALNSGKNDYYSVQEGSVIIRPSNATGGTLNANIQRLGEFTNIQINGNITFTSTNYNGNNLIIGTLNSNLYRMTNHVNALIPCKFRLVGASTIHLVGFIYFDGSYTGNLYFNDTQLNGLTELVIETASLSIPTIGS